MRMTEYQLVTQLVTDVSYIELLFLFTYPTIEHDVQQHVTQFLANFVLIVTYQRVTKLIGFLYGIGTQTIVRLLSVPRTFFTEPVHHIQQTPEGLHFFFFRMHSFHRHLQR